MEPGFKSRSDSKTCVGSTISLGEIKHGESCKLPVTQPKAVSAKWGLFCLVGIKKKKTTSNANCLATGKAPSAFLFHWVIFEPYPLSGVSLKTSHVTFKTNKYPGDESVGMPSSFSTFPAYSMSAGNKHVTTKDGRLLDAYSCKGCESGIPFMFPWLKPFIFLNKNVSLSWNQQMLSSLRSICFIL